MTESIWVSSPRSATEPVARTVPVAQAHLQEGPLKEARLKHYGVSRNYKEMVLKGFLYDNVNLTKAKIMGHVNS